MIHELVIGLSAHCISVFLLMLKQASIWTLPCNAAVCAIQQFLFNLGIPILYGDHLDSTILWGWHLNLIGYLRSKREGSLSSLCLHNHFCIATWNSHYRGPESQKLPYNMDTFYFHNLSFILVGTNKTVNVLCYKGQWYQILNDPVYYTFKALLNQIF